ncbi:MULTISPECIES: hypothetical protein [unclassified Xanthobacter]|uniref:hypothetical protein n=1 Tax=unclassified Xanthobacter TaxID=2623496 RepID=UPI001F472314|nr:MULTISPECIES: hypothetical protein [unclassified Xanthobacter]
MDKTAGDGTPRDAASGPRGAELPIVGDPAAAAAYIGALSEELSRLARGNGLTTLAYILEMARLEARDITIARGEDNNRR